jgi:RNA polymerase sigma-70 factor (ECF subfamily)
METSRTSVNDLAKACASSADAAEWEEFLHLAMPLVSLVAMRVCRLWMRSSSPAMVDDIAQEVLVKLCENDRRILRDFEPRGEDSFFGLLRIVSTSVANDYFRRISSVKRGGKVVTSGLDEDPAPNAAVSTRNTREMQHSVLLAQMDQMMRTAPETIGERDRSIFWLYYLQGFTAEEIAGIAGINLSAKGVESALRRVANWLRSRLNGQKQEDFAALPRQETTT